MRSADVTGIHNTPGDGSSVYSGCYELVDRSCSPDFQRQLLDGVLQALDSSGRRALRRVDIRVDERTITLSGRVPSFFLKQMAQHVTASVDGVSAVDNRLVVE
jgi:hypothetical protein